MLTTVREERAGVAVEETAYIVIPAPAYQGQSPVYASAGSERGPDKIELGQIEGDVAVLAARIAERVWARHG